MSAVLRGEVLAQARVEVDLAARHAAALSQAFARWSPRLCGVQTPARSLIIHGVVLGLFLALGAATWWGHGLWVWSLGLAYMAYDSLLLGLVLWGSWPLRPGVRGPESLHAEAPLSLGVLVAAHNEAAVLPSAVAGLLAQSRLPQHILIADDGSMDDTPEVLQRHFGLRQPPLGQTSRTWLQGVALIWLRLPHGGKARALNAALARLDSDIVVTVDADTLLARDALRAMAEAFEAQPQLVAATGVLQPVCAPGWTGRWLQACQQLEYVRNFLTRHAWMRLDGLLLISGAFAGFRRTALIDVGGFDPQSMVEDYEVLHRLRRFGALQHRGWTTAVVGGAQAITDAPATPAAFLRQRRRWFGGFLQTQWWNRDMVGDPIYGAVGTRMLPSKAMDTLQPLFAWFSLAVVLIDVARGTASWMPTVLTLVGLKSVLDLLALLWLTRIHGTWQGTRQPVWQVVLLTLIDPYTFQPLRQLGALLGWWQVCQARQSWGASSRGGLVGSPSHTRS